MTPRERVLTTLDHQEPDRIPFHWGFGPNALIRQALDDYLRPWGLDFAKLRSATDDLLRRDWAPYLSPPAPGTSIWGYTSKGIENAVGGIYQEFDYQPLAGAESVDDIERHPWPSPDNHDYGEVRDRIQAADPHRRLAVLSGSDNPLEILMWMMGLERTLLFLVTKPEVIHTALRHITDYYLERGRRVLEAADGLIDLWFCADDLGGQHGLLFSPQHYRQLVKPYHQELCTQLHEFGVKILYHSDGSCFGLLGDLIEAGVDCLEAVQVECRDMEAEKLKAHFGERLAFCGGVSVQQVLPHRTPDEVREHVSHLKNVLGKGGGYICAPSHAIQDGTPPGNVIAMVEEALGASLNELPSR